jgi:hypothetical protein
VPVNADSAAERLCLILNSYNWMEISMFSNQMIEPVVALVAGILILVRPALLNYIVAIYLIVVGILGLMKY